MLPTIAVSPLDQSVLTLLPVLKVPSNATITATEVAFSKSFVFIVYPFSLLESSTFTYHPYPIY